MKVIQINAVSNGSTGKIMFDIHKELLKKNIESYVVWFDGRKANGKNELFIHDVIGNIYHKIYSRFIGKQGFASKKSTKKLIKYLDKIKPNIVHLHNLHNSSINIEMLMSYLKQNNIKTLWTFHDCWAFTGKCVHFECAKCFKWKKECFKCPLLNESPVSYIDNSNWCFKRKKGLLSDLNLTIVTPSNWLANYVKESFLKKHQIFVINNGIDLDTFKITKSNMREKYHIENKKIILGVANPWTNKKGLNDFLKLSKVIDERFVIVLVGINKEQKRKLPCNVIGIEKTENQSELAGIYSSSDVFVNCTYEDNYPTVNIESIACGTPVLTYDTGGSVEFLKFLKDDINSNYIINKDDVKKDICVLKYAIEKVTSLENRVVVDRAGLSKETMIDKYISLYNQSGGKNEDNILL